MKRELTGMAMAVLLLGTASCSKNEIDEPNGAVIPPTGKGVTLGVNVGVSTGAQTKSAVTGTTIKYATADYSKVDHAIGLVVTNEDATGYYAPETDNFNTGYTGYGTTITDLCFMGNEEGKNWKAIDATGTFPTSPTAEKEKTFYLDKNRGQIFAYFPFDKTKKVKATVAGGKVTFPINIVATSNNKLATVDNSAKTFASGAWGDNAAASKVNILAEETDYLYFEPTDGKGRYVNNGSKLGDDGTVTTPDGTNTDENPGNSITLSMKHALSMVTFRLYDKDLVVKAPSTATTANLGSVLSFKIENVVPSTGPLKIGETTMDLSVTGGASPIDVTAASYKSGAIERTLDGKYLLIRARQEGTNGETASATTYLFPSGSNGRDAANNISTLVYPITSMEANSVKVTFNILEPGAQAAKAFPLTTILTVPEDGGWLPNKNYIYTFSVSKKGLNVVDVTVADWESVEVGGVVDL